MKCPYCAEEIKDEAVFCRHCNHDFGLVKPLLARLITLESKVKAVEAKPDPLTAKSDAFAAFSGSMSAALCLIFTSGYFFMGLYGTPPIRNLASYIVAIVVPPAVFGLFAGFVAARRHSMLYLAAGLSCGLLNLLFLWLMSSGASFRALLAILTFGVCQPLTFFFLSTFGSSLYGRWRPEIDPELVTSKMALVFDFLKSLGSIVITMFTAFKMMEEALS